MTGKIFAANVRWIRFTAISAKGLSMIINERQIMQLIMISRNYIEELNKQDMIQQVKAVKLIQIVEEIINQQPKELKMIE